MPSSSDQSIAYRNRSELLLHNYSSGPNVPLHSLTQFTSNPDHIPSKYNEGPFPEHLLAGRTRLDHPEQMETALGCFERRFSTNENIKSKQHGISGLLDKVADNHANFTSKARNTTRVQYTEAELTRRITEWLLDWLGRWAMGPSSADGSGGHVTSGSSYAPATGVSVGESSNSNRRGKRRKKTGRDGDEDNNGASKRVKTHPPPRDKQEYLACPFLKHNPERYVHDERCSRHSWPTVSRLKTDHIFRYHEVSGIQCIRCGDITLSGHYSCAERDFTPREGADASMAQQLRAVSTARGGSEEDKWHAVYSILYPLIAREDHPSPYLDNDWQARREIITLLRPNIGPIVTRWLQANNYDPGWASWVENISDGVTNDIVRLVRGFRRPGPLTTPNNDLVPLPNNSSQTRDGPFIAPTNQTAQSNTEDDYPDEFNGSVNPGELSGGGFDTLPADESDFFSLAADLEGHLEDNLPPAMSTTLSRMDTGH